MTHEVNFDAGKGWAQSLDCPGETLGKGFAFKGFESWVRSRQSGRGSHLSPGPWEAKNLHGAFRGQHESSVCGAHRVGDMDRAGGRAVTNQAGQHMQGTCVMPRSLSFYPQGDEEPVDVRGDGCDHIFI